MSTVHTEAAGVMSAQCLCFRVRRVSRVLTRLYDEALRGTGVQATQLTLINAIAMICATGDGASMSRLAEIMAMDLTTVSRNVRPLRSDGLVSVERSRHDGRVRVVKLTGAGEEKLAELLPAWQKAHERVLDLLGRELAEELRDGFDATVEAAAESEAER